MLNITDKFYGMISSEGLSTRTDRVVFSPLDRVCFSRLPGTYPLISCVYMLWFLSIKLRSFALNYVLCVKFFLS